MFWLIISYQGCSWLLIRPCLVGLMTPSCHFAIPK